MLENVKMTEEEQRLEFEEEMNALKLKENFKKMDKKICEQTEEAFKLLIDAVSDDFMLNYKQSWRMKAFRNDTDSKLKRFDINLNIDVGGFTDDQTDIVSRWIKSKNKFKDYCFEVILYVLLPDLLVYLVQSIFECDEEFANKYLNEGGSKMYTGNVSKKKERKGRKPRAKNKRLKKL